MVGFCFVLVLFSLLGIKLEVFCARKTYVCYVCVCVCVCVQAGMGAHVHECVYSLVCGIFLHWFLFWFFVLFLRQSFSLNLKLTNLARLAGWRVPGTLPSLPFPG